MNPEIPAKSPFKFLDPYGKDDINFFFGRDEEIEKLYQSVNKNRIVLVYGLSGTGKTSLVQCGLTERFDVTDWVPFFIRRGCNLNASLKESLIQSKAIGGGVEELTNSRTVADYLQIISKRYLRNVFLVFDQFEELLIIGDEEEKKEFISTLREILVSNDTQFCNFIFILREEYFAQLEFFEEVIPGFSDRRMRVEHMRPTQVTEVITKTCKYFNVRFEKEEDNVKQILHLLTEKTGIHLPYLQIYLDQLWREDYKRSYPRGYMQKGAPPLEFTGKEIDAFGDIRDVLRRFLDERMKTIQENYKAEFPGMPDNTVNSVLDAFVTDKGTKLPIPFVWKDEERVLAGNVPKVLRQIDKKQLEFCLEQFQTNRILREDASSIELAHDYIAEFIYQQRPREQRKLDEMETQIIRHYDDFSQSGEYLSKKQVVMYEDSIPLLDLDDEHKKFFFKSKQYHERRSYIKMSIWVVSALVIFMIIQAFQNSKASDKQYASIYIGFRIDPIENDNDALRVAKYIYDKDLVSKQDQAIFKEKFLKIFQRKDVQDTFCDYKRKFRKTIFTPEEFDISRDGSYFTISDSISNNGKKIYTLYSTSSTKAIDTFVDVEYAYFINRPHTLVIATSVPVEFESQSINLNYPNQFILYDCSTKQKEIIKDSTRQLKEVDLQLDRLYSVDEMANQKSDYDSYRIRYTDSNNLVVPYVHEIEATGLLMQKVRIYRNGRSFKDLNSSSSISISKNEKYLMTGGNVGDKFGVSVYSQSGNLISFIPNIYFGDFTGSSQVMYIRQGTLVFRDNSGDTSNRIYVHSRMYYAYADAENKFALAKTSDSLLFLIDINKKSFQTLKETLQGVDFKKGIFITTPKHGSRLATMVNKWDFEGKKLDSFSNKEGFKQVIFNEQTGEVLALNKTFQLFWLNKDLVPRTAFQITTNDPFGFSKNGQTIYYIRDDFMNMYRYESKPVNLTDFDAAYGWLNTQYHNKKVKFTADERKAYNLNFPSDHFFGGKN